MPPELSPDYRPLGEKAVNIAPAINVAIAQRLVRKVCPECAERKEMSPEIYEEMQKELSILPKNTDMPS